VNKATFPNSTAQYPDHMSLNQMMLEANYMDLVLAVASGEVLLSYLLIEKIPTQKYHEEMSGEHC
jgi:hypothetical protein